MYGQHVESRVSGMAHIQLAKCSQSKQLPLRNNDIAILGRRGRKTKTCNLRTMPHLTSKLRRAHAGGTIIIPDMKLIS